MKNKLLIGLIILLIVPMLSYSQSVKLGMNSSILHPGAKAGYEWAYKTTYLEKTKRSGKVKNITKESLFSGNLGYYHHTGFHDNLYLTFGWTKRRIATKGFFVEFSPEAGISRTFLGGTTYKIDDEGGIEVKNCSGYFYPLVSVGGGIGYDFSKVHKETPFSVYSKLNIISMFPYNSSIYVRPTFELGLSYRLELKNK